MNGVKIKGILVLLIKVLGTLLGFIFYKVVSTDYGSVGVGKFAKFSALILLFGTVFSLGLENYATKIFANINRESLIYKKKLISISFFQIILICPILLFLTIWSSEIVDQIIGISTLKRLLILIMVVISWAVFLYHLGVIKGLAKPILYSYLKFSNVWITSIISYLVLKKYSLEKIDHIFFSYSFGIYLSLIISSFYLFRFKNSKKYDNKHQEFNSLFNEIKSISPFFILIIVLLINQQSTILFNDKFLDDNDIGILSVCLKLGNLMILPVMGINIIVSPKISTLHNEGNLQSISKLSIRCAWYSFILGLLVFLFYCIFSTHLLNLFGTEFKKGYLSLLIICIGFLFTTSSCTVGFVYQMGDYQKQYIVVCLIAFFLQLILILMLTKNFGINGAAFAYSASMICISVIGSLYLFKVKGIKTSLLIFNNKNNI